MQGIEAAPVTVPAGSSTTRLNVKFENAKKLGPFNMPVVIRATLNSKNSPIVGEFRLSVRQ
jgi:hypothetical protein